MLEILSGIPQRTKKPRNIGITMMMDKGMSYNQAKEFLESNSEYTDIIKLGFGTSIITPNIKDKIRLYQENKIPVYAGGTLFEIFTIRNQIEEYKRYLKEINLEIVEISDGSINIPHETKCKYIAEFKKDFRVISEIGSKNANLTPNTQEWIQQMKEELTAGSWKVIAEAREGGNTGIFKNDGDVKSDMVDDIVKEINSSNIIWETPKKEQQVWFINKFGANVNLGNISRNDVIPLECLRLGLRGDTLNNYINK